MNCDDYFIVRYCFYYKVVNTDIVVFGVFINTPLMSWSIIVLSLNIVVEHILTIDPREMHYNTCIYSEGYA